MQWGCCDPFFLLVFRPQVLACIISRVLFCSGKTSKTYLSTDVRVLPLFPALDFGFVYFSQKHGNDLVCVCFLVSLFFKGLCSFHQIYLFMLCLLKYIGWIYLPWNNIFHSFFIFYVCLESLSN